MEPQLEDPSAAPAPSLVYDFEPGFEPGNKNSWFAGIIGANKDVLEVGCATGYVGEYLVDHLGCSVTGIELVPAAAEKARARGSYREVLVGDINSEAILRSLQGRSFDFVLFGDVLEHLTDPAAALRSTARLLRDGGKLLVCVPNVVHWSMRWRVLLGRFDYTETGILDRTHVRFFTRASLRELVTSVGLTVNQSGGVVWLPSAARHLPNQIRQRVERWSARLAPNLVYGQTLLALQVVAPEAVGLDGPAA